MSALRSQGLDVTHIPAGKSGHKSTDMLARLQAEVIDTHPQWMTLSCGVNDVPGRPKTFGSYFYGGDVQNELTTDGCHMNAAGNKMMARGVLRGFGMTAQLAEAEKAW